MSDDCELIFSANTGRSGSAYLAKLIDLSPMVDAGHERLPAMTGPWLRDVAHNGLTATRPSRRLKVATIQRELEALEPEQIYADTSHMFIKTFADVVFEAFDHERITVLHLHRDPILIAKSFYELGIFGPNSGTWHDWMVMPTSPASAFHLDRATVTDQFDLIFGCLVDSFARTERFREQAPDVRWIDVELDAVASEAGAVELFHTLRVPVPAALDSVVGTVPNTKPVEKTRADQSCSREFVQTRWESFARRFAQRPLVERFTESEMKRASA